MESPGLATGMAEQCRAHIEKWKGEQNSELPQPLHFKHLLWMCQRIEKHAETWPATKVHRWIGFIQGGMLANRMIDLEMAKRMFDDVKVAFGKECEDLIDHLNDENPYEVDIGGQG